MTFNEFIFSDRKPIKLTRHLTFWGVFGIQYYLQSLVPINNLFYTALVSVMCYLPACILSVYFILHFLRPILQQRRYLLFISGLAFLTLVLLVLNHFASMLFFWLTCDCAISSITFIQFLQLGSINSAHAFTTGIIVLGFKVAKDWIVKQKENQRLINLKAAHEVRLQKARVYPGLLFQSLTNLHGEMISGSANSPEIILRLSDLLSYLLYESSEELISVEKELNMISNFLSIQKINEPQHLTICSSIDLDSPRGFMKPLILFPFLQNCFEMLGNAKSRHVIHLEFTTRDQMLCCSFAIEKGNEKSLLTEWSQLLAGIDEKLTELRKEVGKLTFENQESVYKVAFNVALTDHA